MTKDEQIDQLQRQNQAMREAIPFPEITKSNALSIAFHVEQGEAFGGLTQAALGEWLRVLADHIEAYSKSLQPDAGDDLVTRERIYTRCPACGNDTLTVNKGHLLCTWHECKDPTLIDNNEVVAAICKDARRIYSLLCLAEGDDYVDVVRRIIEQRDNNRRMADLWQQTCCRVTAAVEKIRTHGTTPLWIKDILDELYKFQVPEEVPTKESKNKTWLEILMEEGLEDNLKQLRGEGICRNGGER